MSLSPNQQHAVAMLALGHDTSSVARDLDICRQTLCRWKRQPEFQRALERELGEMMAALNTQVQSTARVLVAGGLESAQQLRHMLVKPATKDQERRISAQTLLKFAQRFWDLLGYNANLANPRKLLSEDLDQLQDAESIPELLPDAEPGDRDLRSECERDPVGPESHAGAEPGWYSEWRFSPIHDDGTPKPSPIAPEFPGAEPREQSEEFQDEVSEAASDREEPGEFESDNVIAVPASFVVRAARPVEPGPTRQTLASKAPTYPAKQKSRRQPVCLSRVILLRRLLKQSLKSMRTTLAIVTGRAARTTNSTATAPISCNILSHSVALTMSTAQNPIL